MQEDTIYIPHPTNKHNNNQYNIRQKKGYEAYKRTSYILERTMHWYMSHREEMYMFGGLLKKKWCCNTLKWKDMLLKSLPYILIVLHFAISIIISSLSSFFLSPSSSLSPSFLLFFSFFLFPPSLRFSSLMEYPHFQAIQSYRRCFTVGLQSNQNLIWSLNW